MRKNVIKRGINARHARTRNKVKILSNRILQSNNDMNELIDIIEEITEERPKKKNKNKNQLKQDALYDEIENNDININENE